MKDKSESTNRKNEKKKSKQVSQAHMVHFKRKKEKKRKHRIANPASLHLAKETIAEQHRQMLNNTY